MPRIDARTLDGLVRRIREIPRPSRAESPPSRAAGLEGGFWAEITGDESGASAGPTGYSWKRIRSDGAGGVEDDPLAAVGTGTAFEVGGAVGVAVGTRAWLRLAGFVDNGSGTQVPIFLFVLGGGGATPVAVEVDGGAGGSSTTQASWTYTVRDLAGNLLGSSVTPAMQRHPKGATLSATHGLSYFASDGALVLLWVDEALDTEAC